LGWSLAVSIPGVALGASVQVTSALSSTGDTAQETGLGDVVADAVRQAGGTDVALVAADEITETSISAGNVSDAQFVKALRYSDDPTDTVVILTLTGAQLRQVMERSVSRVPQPFDGFFQVSGLSVHYDSSKPQGSRVVSLSVAGASVQDGQTYRVATTRPVADGSFGYFRLWSKSDISQVTNTTIADAVAKYLASQRTLNAPSQDRITP
jgi:2',3'-cyclic-nucleotide 2'-phosphodiesterase (5'-nucleotidase family)